MWTDLFDAQMRKGGAGKGAGKEVDFSFLSSTTSVIDWLQVTQCTSSHCILTLHPHTHSTLTTHSILALTPSSQLTPSSHSLHPHTHSILTLTPSSHSILTLHPHTLSHTHTASSPPVSLPPQLNRGNNRHPEGWGYSDNMGSTYFSRNFAINMWSMRTSPPALLTEVLPALASRMEHWAEHSAQVA
jgi:hypothetical protein